MYLFGALSPTVVDDGGKKRVKKGKLKCSLASIVLFICAAATHFNGFYVDAADAGGLPDVSKLLDLGTVTKLTALTGLLGLPIPDVGKLTGGGGDKTPKTKKPFYSGPPTPAPTPTTAKSPLGILNSATTAEPETPEASGASPAPTATTRPPRSRPTTEAATTKGTTTTTTEKNGKEDNETSPTDKNGKEGKETRPTRPPRPPTSVAPKNPASYKLRDPNCEIDASRRTKFITRVYRYRYRTQDGRIHTFNEKRIFQLRPVYFVQWFVAPSGLVRYARVRKYLLPEVSRYRANKRKGQENAVRYWKKRKSATGGAGGGGANANDVDCNLVEFDELPKDTFTEKFPESPKSLNIKIWQRSHREAEMQIEFLKDWTTVTNSNTHFPEIMIFEDTDDENILDDEEPDENNPPEMPDDGEFLEIEDVYSEDEDGVGAGSGYKATSNDRSLLTTSSRKSSKSRRGGTGTWSKSQAAGSSRDYNNDDGGGGAGEEGSDSYLEDGSSGTSRRGSSGSRMSTRREQYGSNGGEVRKGSRARGTGREEYTGAHEEIPEGREQVRSQTRTASKMGKSGSGSRSGSGQGQGEGEEEDDVIYVEEAPEDDGGGNDSPGGGDTRRFRSIDVSEDEEETPVVYYNEKDDEFVNVEDTSNNRYTIPGKYTSASSSKQGGTPKRYRRRRIYSKPSSGAANPNYKWVEVDSGNNANAEGGDDVEVRYIRYRTPDGYKVVGVKRVAGDGSTSEGSSGSGSFSSSSGGSSSSGSSGSSSGGATNSGSSNSGSSSGSISGRSISSGLSSGSSSGGSSSIVGMTWWSWRTVIYGNAMGNTCTPIVSNQNGTSYMNMFNGTEFYKPDSKNSVSVSIYQDSDFRGKPLVVQLTPQQCVNIHLIDPAWNDVTSSIDPGAACVIVWEHKDCTGQFACFKKGSQGATDFANVGSINDELTSIQLC